MEAYADPLQYFEPDKPNDVKPEEVIALKFSSVIPYHENPYHYVPPQA